MLPIYASTHLLLTLGPGDPWEHFIERKAGIQRGQVLVPRTHSLQAIEEEFKSWTLEYKSRTRYDLSTAPASESETSNLWKPWPTGGRRKGEGARLGDHLLVRSFSQKPQGSGRNQALEEF